MKTEERASLVHDACFKKWRDNRGDFSESRNGKFLVYDRRPDYVLNKEGSIVGVDAWVRLFGQNGIEIPIDPHRRIVNPPITHQGIDDPLGAFTDIVWKSVLNTPNPKGWRTQGTVDTLFPSLDGRLDAQGASYSTAREGSGTIAVTTTTATTATGQFFQTTYSCYQQYYAFDTSSIEDTDVVTSVDFALWLINDVSNTDFLVEVREKDWGSSLESSDYVPGSQLGNYTLLASLNTSGIGSTGAYKTFTSETAFLTTTFLKTGTVRFFTSSSRQRLNNTPPSNEYVQFSQSSTSGTTQDPKLTITHNALTPFEGWGYPL